MLRYFQYVDDQMQDEICFLICARLMDKVSKCENSKTQDGQRFSAVKYMPNAESLPRIKESSIDKTKF